MFSIDNFLTFAPLLITLIGIIYYTRLKMIEMGIIYTLLIYFKWFLGVIITMFAFYMMMISGNYLQENGFNSVFSLAVGAFVWFVPMHYSSQIFLNLENRFKKEK